MRPKAEELRKNTSQPNGGGQRWAPATRTPEGFVRRRVVSEIRSRDRRASFTAAELRNARATSGSKTATFAPSLMRLAADGGCVIEIVLRTEVIRLRRAFGPHDVILPPASIYKLSKIAVAGSELTKMG